MTFVGNTIKYLDVGELHEREMLAALSVLLPEKIGAGVFRDVYEIAGRPDVVLKIERRGLQFCNVAEWTIWKEAEHLPAGKWLAPCVDISHDGRALLMKRTRPISDKAWERLEVPAFFTDTKQENWGTYQGRPVCHDYALNHAIRRGLTIGKLQPAVPRWMKGEG